MSERENANKWRKRASEFADADLPLKAHIEALEGRMKLLQERLDRRDDYIAELKEAVRRLSRERT